MSSLIQYAIQVILCSGVFSLYYVLALRNKSFNIYNRFYLITTSLLSVLLPLIKIDLAQPKTNINTNTWQTDIQVIAETNAAFNEVIETQTATVSNFSWMWFVYIILAVFLFFKLSRAVFKMVYLIKKHQFTKVENAWFAQSIVSGTPFSFLNYIFWNENQPLQTPIAQKMLAHELAHVQQKHTLDILFFKTLNCVFWFNPFNWYVQKEIQTIHEFLADEQAIQQGNEKELAAMLLQAVQPSTLSLIHPFFLTSIKRRINMINNNNKSKSYLMRLLPLPLMLLVFTLFAFAIKSPKENAFNKIYNVVIEAGHGGADIGVKGNNLDEKTTALKHEHELNKQYTVVIDAGHGGADKGANGNNLEEKAIALKLALAIKQLNTNQNVNLVFTRTEDVFQHVKEKAQLANNANPNLFVSLHVNDSPPEKNEKSGIEVYVSSKNKFYELSKQLANTINKEFEGFTLQPLGIKERISGIYVLQEANCPAVLFEAGFIDNEKDAALLKDKTVINIIAQKILNGIYAYLQLAETSNNNLPQADSTPKAPNKNMGFVSLSNNNIENNPLGATEEQLNEYATIINAYRENGKLKTKEIFEMPATKKERLEFLFKQMSKEQQGQQEVYFISPLKPIAKSVPTNKQVESWYNASLFGVWINDKKVNNQELKKYTAKDFAYHDVSKLYKNARKNVSYFYQVNLMTNDYYADYYKKQMADKKNLMVVRSGKWLAVN